MQMSFLLAIISSFIKGESLLPRGEYAVTIENMVKYN
jgi:hypothetical protein